MTVKIRLNFQKELREFETRQQAFDWVRSNVGGTCVVSVLSFERGTFESMERWHYDGNRFSRENITS